MSIRDEQIQALAERVLLAMGPALAHGAGPSNDGAYCVDLALRAHRVADAFVVASEEMAKACAATGAVR